ncbi:MAG: ABC transporter ATP-binding protein [Calditrichota bacterium]
MSNYIVQASGLGKTYRVKNQSLEVLKGVDLKVESGETISIVGPSGAGKSTLLHLLGGLETPTCGQVFINGKDVSHLSEQDRSRLRLEKIGFIFQFHHLLSEFTALENVMLPGLILGQERSVCAPRAADLLDQVGLAERIQHKPGELSGGEQQRVALARALMNQPSLILADEPTGNLDLESARRMQQLLWQICADHQATVLIVTHNLEFANSAARVLQMEDGRLSNANVKVNVNHCP